MPPECFVRVINLNDGNGTILLRQSATDRYATVSQEPTFLDFPKISFLFGTIGKDAEFRLIAPNGNEADGVAIRSVDTNRYVVVDLLAGSNYLYPICEFEDISANGLFRFERRFGYF